VNTKISRGSNSAIVARLGNIKTLGATGNAWSRPRPPCGDGLDGLDPSLGDDNGVCMDYKL